ncbi:MAG: hypothetical protein WD734_00730 [Dehalococcoidia bacterium]
MEWVILGAVAALVAAYVALPRRGDEVASAADPAADLDGLRGERDALLASLRDLDDDAAAGRIDATDRAAGRRALGPRLRAVTEALRARGETSR